MIEVKHLTKRFGAVTALDNISFQVDSGSIFGLVGSNGAGKSTFLRTAAGVYRPDAGSVLIDGGEPFENLSVKGNVCFISDYPYFPRTATLTDMEDLFSHTYPHWDKERFHYLCSCFPLDTKQRILNMSKGMQRQAAILCALGARPTHLLLDEIFDGLDPVMRQLLKRILSGEVSDRGMTVVIASHNLRELEDICDHVGLFHRGGVIFDRELDSLKLGISRVQVCDPYDLKQTMRVIREELEAEGPSVIISRRPCALLKYVKHKPSLRVESSRCIGCKACLAIGCPAISMKEGKAAIDHTQCVGCGVCTGLCPKQAITES